MYQHLIGPGPDPSCGLLQKIICDMLTHVTCLWLQVSIKHFQVVFWVWWFISLNISVFHAQTSWEPELYKYCCKDLNGFLSVYRLQNFSSLSRSHGSEPLWGDLTLFSSQSEREDGLPWRLKTGGESSDPFNWTEPTVGHRLRRRFVRSEILNQNLCF